MEKVIEFALEGAIGIIGCGLIFLAIFFLLILIAAGLSLIVWSYIQVANYVVNSTRRVR